MSNAIQFLESLGRNPKIFGQSAEAYAVRVTKSEVDLAQQQALLERDANSLSGLLGGRERMMMQVWAPQEDEADEQPQQDAGVDCQDFVH